MKTKEQIEKRLEEVRQNKAAPQTTPSAVQTAGYVAAEIALAWVLEDDGVRLAGCDEFKKLDQSL